MVDVLAPALVADFLLVESRERGEVLTNLKLQKLLYYADGWFAVASGGRPLFEEAFQAWVHGPVLPSQYRRFRDFRWRPLDVDVARPPGVAADVEKHLVEVVDVFGCETAVALELMTHRELPWIEARGGLPTDAASTTPISKSTMLRYFKALDANAEIRA